MFDFIQIYEFVLRRTHIEKIYICVKILKKEAI